MPEKGFPGGSVVKNLQQYGRHEFTPGSGRSLGKEMATYSSILAWEIPWTEQSGGQQTKGSQKSQTQLRDITTTMAENSNFHLYFYYLEKNKTGMTVRISHQKLQRSEGNGMTFLSAGRNEL